MNIQIKATIQLNTNKIQISLTSALWCLSQRYLENNHAEEGSSGCNKVSKLVKKECNLMNLYCLI